MATFSQADHWRFFTEFCRWEKAAGGPDPQIAMVGHMAGNLWGGLCYIATYNVPFGEIIWSFPRHDLKAAVEEAFAKNKIVTRVERRCVRRPEWMLEYLRGAELFLEEYDELVSACGEQSGSAAYELAWDRALHIPRVGRYVAMKLIEYLRRYCALPVTTPDIRPRGAWSPRETLAELLGDKELAAESDRPQVLSAVNKASNEVLSRLKGEYDLELDMFELQVLLCEYRESWEGKRQYPGRSLDSELGYARKAAAFWGTESQMWAARRALFPHEHLGEIHGWEGPRKDVASVLATHRYTWSDLLYDYKTTTNFAAPISR